MGPRGAGHYVKMVHNGIEYGDMQLIAEAYDLLHRGAGVPVAELAGIFAEWNRGDLRSYLIEITAQIFETLDPDTGRPIVDVILDEAQQKGTGKWMSQNAFDVGAPIPTVNAAVEARLISALKTERVAASRVLRVRPAGSPATATTSSSRRARRCTRARSPRMRRAWPSSARRRPSTTTTFSPEMSRRSGAPAASSARHCSATSATRFGATPALVNLMTDAAFSDALGATPAGLARTRSRRRSASAFRCRP